jgi:hypothetical protein
MEVVQIIAMRIKIVQAATTRFIDILPQAVFCLEAVQAHLLEQPRHVGKKCKGASFSAPGA